MSEWKIQRDEAGVRLDKYLAAADRLGSRARAIDAIARRKIFVNDREATVADAGVRLSSGDVVRVWMDRPGSAKRHVSLGDARDLRIVYEDEHLLVLDKPSGILAVPLPPDRRENARSVFDDVKTYLRRRGRSDALSRVGRRDHRRSLCCWHTHRRFGFTSSRHHADLLTTGAGYTSNWQPCSAAVFSEYPASRAACAALPIAPGVLVK